MLPCECDFCLRPDAQAIRDTTTHLPPNFTETGMNIKASILPPLKVALQPMKKEKPRSCVRGSCVML